LPLWGVIRMTPETHSTTVYRALRPSRVDCPLIAGSLVIRKSSKVASIYASYQCILNPV
jgi:hypothetical protein